MALSRDFDSRLNTIIAQIYETAGETFNINSPQQLAHILFRPAGPSGREEDKDLPLDGQRGAPDACRPPPPARPDTRVPDAREAEEHLRGQPPCIDPSVHRQDTRRVQSDGRRHGPPVEQRSQPPEYPRQGGGRQEDKGGLCAGGRVPLCIVRLFPDRAARARPYIGGRAAHRRLPERPGHPHQSGPGSLPGRCGPA